MNLNPTGFVPTLVDHDEGGYAVMEGMPILNYLARNFHTEFKFSFDDLLEASTAEQWLAWQHGTLGLCSSYIPFMRSQEISLSADT